MSRGRGVPYYRRIVSEETTRDFPRERSSTLNTRSRQLALQALQSDREISSRLGFLCPAREVVHFRECAEGRANTALTFPPGGPAAGQWVSYRKPMGKKESAGKSSDAMGPSDIAGRA
ncbi:hypothetical protein KM043_009201 [Ampulex compressa]|nr:hypothetical protein KM043_009201 [Ampulex compressa]